MKSLKLLPAYAILIAICLLFVFPFYWVFISSLESISGLNLKPPALYPAELKTISCQMNIEGLTYEQNSNIWVHLCPSAKNLTKDSKPILGAYYLKLEKDSPSSKYTATELVNWFPDSSLSSISPRLTRLFPKAITQHNVIFPKVPIETVNGRSVGTLAKQIRGNGTNLHTIIFTIPVSSKFINTNLIKPIEDPTEERQLVYHAKWSNYSETLKGPEASIGSKSSGFLLFMRNSLFLAGFAVVAQILSSSFVAFGFSRLKFKGRDPLFLVLLATLMIPGQVTLIPLFFIFKSIHWVNSFLPLMIPQLTAGAFNVFLIRQFLLNFPKELDESATIDGASSWRIYRSVILPNCGPVLIIVGLFTFVASWQDILGPLIYLDSPSLRTVSLGLDYFRSPYVDNRPLLLAGAVLSIIPVFLLFLVAQRYILSGIATTGLKG